MRRIVTIVFALLALPVAASADSFSATFAGTGLGARVKGYNGGSYFDVFAGQIKWDAGVDFLAFCIQLDSTLQYTQEFESNPDLLSASKTANISYLVTKNFSSVTTNWMAAGLQLAIWNVLYDNDTLASTGSFWSSTSSATYFADKFLSDLANQENPTGSAVFLNSLPANRGQDQVTLTAVPEPGTLLLLGSGVAALAARRRLRRA